MTVALVYDPRMADYRFPAGHPMRPERFTLAVELMREWGLIDVRARGARSGPASEVALGAPGGVPRAITLKPTVASDEDLLLFHDPDYVAAVKAAGEHTGAADYRFGLGSGDNPAFPDMHEAAALAVGGTVLALDAVLDGRAARTFNPAGGLHHAHRDRAAGFCVYNDAAIAIERATREHPGLRVAYVDVDAHHGDGVQEAFWTRADVLTLSVHESGRFLFPGTGAVTEVGEGAGRGFSLNVPLPPGAGADSYALVLDEVVAPALEAFAPDVIVAQLGGDSHDADPLTHLANTVAGYAHVVERLVAIGERVCGGRLAAVGGGGYEPFSVVPRQWACALASLMHADVPETLPEGWLELSARAAGWSRPPVVRTFDEFEEFGAAGVANTDAALILTGSVVAQARASSPLLSE